MVLQTTPTCHGSSDIVARRTMRERSNVRIRRYATQYTFTTCLLFIFTLFRQVTTRSPTPPRSPSLSCTHTSSLTPTLQELHASMPALRPGWTDQTTSSPLQDTKLCKVSCQPSSSSSLQPMFVSHSLTITSDLTWKAYVSGHDVTSKIMRNHRFRLILGSLIPSHSVHFCCYSTPLEYVQGIQRSNFSR